MSSQRPDAPRGPASAGGPPAAGAARGGPAAPPPPPPGARPPAPPVPPKAPPSPGPAAPAGVAAGRPAAGAPPRTPPASPPSAPRPPASPPAPAKAAPAKAAPAPAKAAAQLSGLDDDDDEDEEERKEQPKPRILSAGRSQVAAPTSGAYSAQKAGPASGPVPAAARSQVAQSGGANPSAGRSQVAQSGGGNPGRAVAGALGGAAPGSAAPSGRPEPTIAIDSDLAALAETSQRALHHDTLPEGVPKDIPKELLAILQAAGNENPDKTRIMSTPVAIQPTSGKLVRPTGVQPRVQVSPQHMPLAGGDDNDNPDKTRIVMSLNLSELQDPRQREPRSTGVQAVVNPASRPMTAVNPAVASRPMTAVNPAVASRPMTAVNPAISVKPQSGAALAIPAEAPAGGPKKAAPVKQVKARSKAKVTPLDPSRLLTLQEAAERKAQEEQSGVHGSFERIGGHVELSLGGEEGAPPQQEQTMIGRFLGLVGLTGGPAPKVEQRDTTQELWDVVKATPFLDGVNPQFISEAIAVGDLRLLSLGRDMLLNDVYVEGRAVLVREGQLALARFRPEVLDRERKAQAQYKAGDRRAEKKEFNRRQEVGPLIRLCEANLALFTEGDLIGLEGRAEGQGVAVYSVTPVKVLSIARARLEAWRRTYQFFSDRVRRAGDAARRRIDANSGARSLVADFFVRNGLSVAMTLRVRELDKCIECYECEKACESRYGVKRLSLNGKVLGALDFVDCCHTCVDQRCIDPCAYDAITFDQETKEVLILEDACTGCSLCASACPYDAIEMHELDEKPLLQIRLNKDGKLGFGEGKPRKAKLRRIASKCDHCVTYEDQACISACPTGALLEIPPEAAFIERTEGMAEAARGGFDHTAMVDAAQLFNPKKFFHGMEAEDDKGRVVDKRLNTSLLWGFGVLAFLVCLVEVLLRRAGSEHSGLFYYYTKLAVPVMEPEVARENLSYRSGDSFAVWLGWIGTVVMFASTLYSAHKWIPGLKKLGSQRAWFDFHVWAGTIGPLFVLLHSAAKLDNWVSFAVWAMIITVVSGLVGRYLSTELPDLASQAALHVLELDRQLGELRNKHSGVAAADRYYEAARRRFARVSAPELSGAAGSLLAVTTLLRDELSRPLRRFKLRGMLKGVKDPRARREVARLTSHLVLLERRRLLLPRIGPLFKEWKAVHIPFAIILTILSGIHIIIELRRQ